MMRERALKVVLVIVGLAFLATLYPLAASYLGWMQVNAAEQMILAIYFPIGAFLLLALRDPGANRTLIACVGWSTLAHGAVMIVQELRGQEHAGLPFLAGVALFSAALIVLAPPAAGRHAVPRATTHSPELAGAGGR